MKKLMEKVQESGAMPTAAVMLLVIVEIFSNSTLVKRDDFQRLIQEQAQNNAIVERMEKSLDAVAHELSRTNDRLAGLDQDVKQLRQRVNNLETHQRN